MRPHGRGSPRVQPVAFKYKNFQILTNNRQKVNCWKISGDNNLDGMLLTVSRKSHHPVETLLALKALKHLLIKTHAQKFDHLVVTCSINFL